MSDHITLTLPIPAQAFWTLTLVLGVAALSAVIYAMIPRGPGRDWLTPIQQRLGVQALPGGIALFLFITWTALLIALIFGLFWVLHNIALHFVTTDVPGHAPSLWSGKPATGLDLRWSLLTLTALTATTGVVIGLPFTLIRLTLTRNQTETATDSLFNDKITAAAADLHTRRQVTHDEGKKSAHDVWADDIIRRNAAIDRLEGLVSERPDTAERVARLLSIYVRELSREYPPIKAPETNDIEMIKAWARRLTPVRSDMENAVKVLGRLTKTAELADNTLPIDLRDANLQGFDLAGLDLRMAQMMGAHLQGARLEGALLARTDLSDAHMEGANFWNAHLEYANLRRALLRGADLWGAQLQEARLGGAHLQGAQFVDSRLQDAHLWGAQLQGARLGGAHLQRAILQETQLQGAHLGGAHLQGAMLGDTQCLGTHLRDANLQGVYLRSTQFDPSTDLSAASFRGAALKEVDLTAIPQIAEHLDDTFADRSVTPPTGTNRPAHWPAETLDGEAFHTAWRAWQQTLDPPLPPAALPPYLRK